MRDTVTSTVGVTVNRQSWGVKEAALKSLQEAEQARDRIPRQKGCLIRIAKQKREGARTNSTNEVE